MSITDDKYAGRSPHSDDLHQLRGFITLGLLVDIEQTRHFCELYEEVTWTTTLPTTSFQPIILMM